MSKSRGRRYHCADCRYRRRFGVERLCRDCGQPRAAGTRVRCSACSEQARRRARAEERRRHKRNPAVRRRELARKLVREAIRAGALVKGPCSQCGATVGVEMHHVNGCDDVREWLNVVPLCSGCHAAAHAV